MATPSHVDLSVLWVPIMPETSKLGPEMEKAGQSATESFGKGSEKLGDKITDAVSKSRDKIKDVFHRSGSDAADAMAESVNQNSKKVEDAVAQTGEKAKGKFRESAKDWGKVLVDSVGADTKKLLGDKLEDVVGGALEGVLGDNAKWGGQFARSIADWGFEELKSKLGGVKDAAKDTKAAFADFKSGDTLGGVSKLVDSFHKIGVDVKDLPGPLGDAVTKLGEAKTMAQTFSDIFKDLPGKIGKVGTAIEGLAGPLAVALQSQKDMDNFISSSGHPELVDPNVKGDKYSNTVQDELRQLAAQGYKPGSKVSPPKPPPGVDMSGVGGIGKGGDVLGSGSDAYDFFSSGKALPSAASGNTVPLVQKPDGTWTSSNPAWAHLIQRESGGNSSIQNNWDSNAAAGDPSRGLFQFTKATWARSGGLKYGPDPGRATPQQQAEIAANLIRSNPSGSDWGAGLPGRENASALLAGVGPGGAVETNYSEGPGSTAIGGGSRSSGTSAAPAGSQRDPLYVTQVDANGQVQKSDTQDISQQFGQGFLDGIGQSVGLDGSVFKGFGGASNPKDFGITKLGMGLLNHLLPGNGASPGESISRGVIPMGPGGAQNVRTDPGDTYNFHGPINTGMSVTQNGVQSPTGSLNDMNNSSRTSTATLPNAGTLPSS